MARTVGARNAKYDEQRLLLARKVREHVMGKGGIDASLRSLALAADTSVANLKHYFGDRLGVMKAVLESLYADAAPHLARASTPSSKNLGTSLKEYLRGLWQAWFAFGVGRVQAMSLALGLGTTELGSPYVTFVLEPLLQSAEQLFRRHMELGQMRAGNPRYAALQFLSPVVLALLHQDSLSGATCRPLDLDDFLAVHTRAFVAAHRPSAAG